MHHKVSIYPLLQWEPLKRWLGETSKPTWGTCAGMILLSDRAMGTKTSGQPLLGGLDVTVHRNYFGSQVASFEAPISVIDGIRGDLGVGADARLPGVFIRAPAVLAVGPSAEIVATVKALRRDASTPDWALGKGLEAGMDGIASVDTSGSSGSAMTGAADGEVIVAVRQGKRFLATAFHPELTSHLGWHRMFVSMVTRHRDSDGAVESSHGAEASAPAKGESKALDVAPDAGAGAAVATGGGR